MNDVHRIAVGADSERSAEGRNSAYVLPDRGVVIDPGPPGDDAWDDLVAGIEAAGLALADVSTVLVTHWHYDHAGQAVPVAEAAGAEVVLHEHDAPLVGDYRHQRERRVERDRRALEQWGVPPEKIEEVFSMDDPTEYPDSYPVTAVADGDSVAGIDVRHTPGHTLGHATYLADGTAFVGDTVLGTTTPNVGGGDTRLSDPLGRYLESLATLDAMDAVARPGHGTDLTLDDRIPEIRAHHAERTARVADVVEERAPVTTWDVAVTLFRTMRGYHVKFGAGEAFAHLAVLDSRGAVDRVAEDPFVYRPSDDGISPTDPH